jgi:hypothetical protein
VLLLSKHFGPHVGSALSGAAVRHAKPYETRPGARGRLPMQLTLCPKIRVGEQDRVNVYENHPKAGPVYDKGHIFVFKALNAPLK